MGCSRRTPLVWEGGHAGECHAKQRSDGDVAGKVDACVHARVGHDGGERTQRYADLRQGRGHSRSEREGGCRVSGRERARLRHSHMASERGTSIGTSPSTERLQPGVHEHRRDGDRSEAVNRGATALAAATHGKKAGDGEPEPGVVGCTGHPVHRAIECGPVDARDSGVQGRVDAVGIAQPLACVHRRQIV